MRRIRTIAGVISALALGLGVCAQSAASPQVQTASASAERKLSPDLRQTLRQPTDQPVLVCVVMEKGTVLPPVMLRSLRSRAVGNIQWVTGEVLPGDLRKLAAARGVLSVTSRNTYRPVRIPGERQFKGPNTHLGSREAKALVAKGGKKLLGERLDELASLRGARTGSDRRPVATTDLDIARQTVKVADVHKVRQAWSSGYTGSGVVVAIVDTGVDFAHPDLQGTQARVSGGAYSGWPFAYDVLSGIYYALGTPVTIGPDTYWDDFDLTWFCHTLPVVGATCAGNTCTGDLKIDFGSDVGWDWPPVTLTFTWPNTSKSGNYRYTVHPDFNLLEAGRQLGLGYAFLEIAPPAVIVADEAAAGVYDTVYVDTDFDRDLTDEKPMRKGSELAGADLFDAAGFPGADGVWDLSAGMLGWIADGTNRPPGVEVVYPGQASIPPAGELVAFIGDFAGHGTSGASDVVAQGVITDPELIGLINPLFAGGANMGGVGGAVLAGMAPDAKIAAIPGGVDFPLDAWLLGVNGFDGIPETGDEAHIINNSWGSPQFLNDGWDSSSRFAHLLNDSIARRITFLVSAGNGGHGYGTVGSPDGATILSIGASTLYGTLREFELVNPSQFLWGDVMPWSNRGPTTLGDLAPHVVAVGAWGTAAYPLNVSPYYGNGQAAYDIFGGTSMASPIACGILALAYEAFHTANGRYPTWQEATTLLLNGAADLGYESLTQGAGNLDGERSAQLAAGNDWRVEPPSWVPGDFQGTKYPAFPSVLGAGESDSRQFTVQNPTAAAISVSVAARELAVVHETTFEVPFAAADPSSFTMPTYLREITNDIATHDPDLVRAQMVFPFSVFDPESDYGSDNLWNVYFYDWTDLNEDGNLWTDTNSNGIVDVGEIDIDPSTGVYEYNRFSYGYPTGTFCEASLGRDSLTRQNDGVFLGLQRAAGTAPATVKVRVAYYKRRNWSWVNVNPANVSVPAAGNGTFSATITVPPATKPGVYEGAIHVSAGGRLTVVPVVVNVSAAGPTFAFGSTSLSDPFAVTPYDNGHLLGGFDWAWDYDSGDWKLFFYEVAEGQAPPGSAIIVDTRWGNAPTDVDTWVFGPAADQYSDADPVFFGPHSTSLIGGSVDTYVQGGLFTFQTQTDGPREVVGAELRTGLNFISLHNVLHAGADANEPYIGNAYGVQTSPFPVKQYGPSGSWTQTFVSAADIAEGIQVTAYGLSRSTQLSNEPIQQDTADDICSAQWVRELNLQDCGTVEISTAAASDMDIDLYIFQDNGNATWDCNTGDPEVAASLAEDSDERIRLVTPADGRYWIVVHGYAVPSSPRRFSIVIRALQGADLAVRDVPAGAVTAGSPVTFSVDWTNAPPGIREGVLLMGPAQAPAILQVPVAIQGVPRSSVQLWALYE